MQNEVSKNQSGISLKNFINPARAQKFLAFGALILLLIFFSFASPYFMTFDNVVSIMLSTCVNGILALGIIFVIITGGIDLSIGTVMTFSSVMAGVTITTMGLPVWVGIIVAIITGTFCGFISGTLVSRLKLQPFIATLGVMMVTKGLSLVLSGTKPIYFSDTPSFRKITVGSFIKFGAEGKYSIPNGILIFAVMAVIAAIILNKTKLGRYNFAIGSNEEATRLSGVNVEKWKTAIFALCGAFAGVAGVVMAARLDSAQPALGQGYELDAIASVVIGGTSMSGGEGTILGTVIGAFIISTLTNGLKVMGVAQEWQIVITGGVLVLAVLLDKMRKR
ncbi:ribose ABC transporter permease [Sporanaerobium hydrogeniformans]|uniref:Ribose ABC transporter permease n=1 Tax=Sporanaerobium hydrogeniformans TaxID=3072179 RepID=A0AC61DGV3_9FIRM|nr:ABC transporter permease [Sporanaerobium hydrogeniformans]PHV72132.1 ribose ABC transporter permease [Sporanaerobium hydrogeniformans]